MRSSLPSQSAVPSCHLYTLEPSQRIKNELQELGLDPHGSEDTNVVLLNKIDGMRYEDARGTLLFTNYINRTFGDEKSARVLDIGAGFGGPSRLLASKRPSTHVTALEYVPEISQMAASLTNRCPEVKDRIQHVTGDIEELHEILQPSTTTPLPLFHAAQAVLSLCHVPNLEAALREVHAQLVDDGILYIEDFWASPDLSEAQQSCLADRVGCSRKPPSCMSWCDVLSKVGFATVDFDDATTAWQPWIHTRREGYEGEMDRHVRVHGEKGAQHMMEFYASMDQLFTSGDLKGCRIYAKKQPLSEGSDDDKNNKTNNDSSTVA